MVPFEENPGTIKVANGEHKSDDPCAFVDSARNFRANLDGRAATAGRTIHPYRSFHESAKNRFYSLPLKDSTGERLLFAARNFSFEHAHRCTVETVSRE